MVQPIDATADERPGQQGDVAGASAQRDPTATAAPGPEVAPRGGRHGLYRVAVGAIVVLAAALRLVPIGAGLPYPGYVDEAHTIIHGADMVRAGSLDPGWYDYPTLPITTSAAVIVLVGLTSPAAERADDLEWTATGTVYDDIRPVGAIVGNRLVAGSLSVATVLLVILATARLTRRRVALVAGLLAAFAPALVSRAALDLVDTMVTFFVLAAFVTGLAASRTTRRGPSYAWAIAAGCCAGLAAGSKYPGGAAITMVMILVVGAGQGSLASRAARSAAAVAAASLTFVAVMPAVITNRQAVLEGVTRNYDRYGDKATGATYWTNAVRVAEVGIPVLVAAAVGVAVLLRRRATRVSTVAWLVYATLLVGVAARLSFQPFRNVLSVVPFLCLAAAVGVDATVRAVGACVRVRDPRLVGGALVATVVLLVGHLAIGGIRPSFEEALEPDSRVAAGTWLRERVQPGDSVVVVEELGFSEAELALIPGSLTVVSAVDGSVRRSPTSPPRPDGASYVVTGTLEGASFPWVPKLGLRVRGSFGVAPVPVALNSHRASRAAILILDQPP